MDCMFEAYLTHETVGFEPDDIPETKNPVWLLGKKYDATKELETIRRDITSKFWFTYRRGFLPIGGESGYTSDKGWGCMLRCGQMLLGQALIQLHLGRNWYWLPETKNSIYLKILKKFEDKKQEPFSIHQIAQTGQSEGKEIGQWFGPNNIAQVLKKLVKFDEWSNLEIHVALDNTVVISDIKKLCKLESSGLNWKPLLLIIPVRLGLSEINPIYFDGLKKCFQFKQSVGMLGGKPNQALFFIGYVGDDIIYLDPHTTQRYGAIDNKSTEEQIELDSTYHCKYANRIPFANMDPSMAIGFLCKNENEFDDLCNEIKKEIMCNIAESLFVVCDEGPKEWEENDSFLQTTLKEFVNIEKDLSSTSDDDDEEFEII